VTNGTLCFVSLIGMFTYMKNIWEIAIIKHSESTFSWISPKVINVTSNTDPSVTQDHTFDNGPAAAAAWIAVAAH
jgi:hypothetical protein